MSEQVNLLLRIKEQLEYQTRLLETLVEAVDERRHAAASSMRDVEKMSKMFLEHPIIQASPEAAKMLQGMLAPMFEMFEPGEERKEPDHD